jgi:hypothetical protein
MATFLSLCSDLARESGAINPAPPTVVLAGLSKRQVQCVSWVSAAWTAIQNVTPFWLWLRGEFEGTLTIGDNAYSPTDMGIATRFSQWVEDTEDRLVMSIYDPAIGRRDETRIRQIPWDAWKDRYDFGVDDNKRPIYWSIAPDNSLRFGSAPDKAYKVRGEYLKAPQVLVADTDVPEMPDRFHSAIWQRALILMSASDEAIPVLQTAQLEFMQNLTNMQRDCLPRITTHSQGPLDHQ